ncbi:hypothetical protein T09_9733, partial [Trichinella sp. T9]
LSHVKTQITTPKACLKKNDKHTNAEYTGKGSCRKANVADPPGKRCNQIALAPRDQFSLQHPSVIFFVHNYHYIDAPPLSATCTCYLKADSFDAATNLTHLTTLEHCCLSLLFFKTFIPLHYSPQCSFCNITVSKRAFFLCSLSQHAVTVYFSSQKGKKDVLLSVQKCVSAFKNAEMLKVWSVDVTETVCKIETVNLQLLFNLNEAEVKRATLTGWSFMLCNQILPSIGNAFSCIVKHPSQGWMTEAK